jgi:hypothetical protein
MQASVRAFLSGIVDYAGLFPPARLPLPEALGNYLRYQAEPEQWMLGRFVCPAARLGELHALLKERSPDRSMAVSCLGRGGSEAAEFLTGLRADLELISVFTRDTKATVDVYETRLPVQTLGQAAALRELLFEAAQLLGSRSLTAYFEIALDEAWRSSISAASDGLKALARAGQGLRHGIKIRCGGAEAKDFPSADQIAGVIHICREGGIPLKATAGLHHPVRHHDVTLGVAMHGFVNVFGAGVLAYATPIDEGVVRAIIADERADHFRFDENGFGHLEHRASTPQIAEARRAFVTSFGSCSFDEPKDGVRKLGLLS